MFYSILEIVVVCSLCALGLQKLIPNTTRNLTKTVKKTSPKTTCFLMLIFSRFGVYFGSFWDALGPHWGRFGRQNGVQEPRQHWGKAVFFSLWSFWGPKLEFSLIWGVFGSVLGGFGEDFGWIWGEFCDDFWRFGEIHRLCLGMAHSMRLRIIALRK